MAMRTTTQPKKPHFFTPIGPGFEKGVEIPTSFLKYLGGKIHENQAVLRRGVKERRVKISDRWLKEGWMEFAVENNLEVGDFVMFEHEGNLVFKVFVFDPSHCERDLPSSDNGTECSRKLKAAVSDNEGISRRKKVNLKQFLEEEESEESPRSKKVTLEEPDDQEEADSTDQNPSFFYTINPTNLYRHRLDIPRAFAQKNNLFRRQCDMILRDQSQKPWRVKLGFQRDRASILGGWKRFAEGQGLKKGDQFKLELTENGEKPVFNFYGPETLYSTKKGRKDQAKRREASYDPDNDHTCFVSTINQSNIRNCTLTLPMEFAKANCLTELNDIEMILNGDRRRRWKVELKHIRSRVLLGQGWPSFRREYGLKEGDSFKFEIIKKGKRPVGKFHCDFVETEGESPT